MVTRTKAHALRLLAVLAARIRSAAVEVDDIVSALAKSMSLKLRLYVAGNEPNSARAIANIKASCAEHFATGHSLEIVELLKYPQRGVDAHIIVTPTLLKLSPKPSGRVIGTLTDTMQVLMVLERR